MRRVAALVLLGVAAQMGILLWRVNARQVGPPAPTAWVKLRVSERDHDLLVTRHVAATQCFTPMYMPGRGGELQTVVQGKAGSGGAAPGWYEPWSERDIQAYAERCSGMVTLARVAIGWPLRSWQGARVYQGMVDRGVIAWLSPSGATESEGYVRIGPVEAPVRPIWIGLGLDVLLVVCAGAMLLGAMDAWRRGRRAKAGECLYCMYDLAGVPGEAPCPECGTKQPRPGGTDHLGMLDG